jgi:hypothetical protein
MEPARPSARTIGHRTSKGSTSARLLRSANPGTPRQTAGFAVEASASSASTSPTSISSSPVCALVRALFQCTGECRCEGSVTFCSVCDHGWMKHGVGWLSNRLVIMCVDEDRAARGFLSFSLRLPLFHVHRSTPFLIFHFLVFYYYFCRSSIPPAAHQSFPGF